ncbi:MAG: SLBB domain-containing protein [Candidatus Omnitrophica bacterium]|nr:SLBB domain-containing protein [Candidatus Omnitrophota bacterium]
MKNFIKFVPAFLILFSCTAGFTQEAPQYESQGADNSEYRLAVNDLIEISVYQESDLSKTARVAPDGTVSFPLLGNLYVKGFTAKQLELTIAALLRKDYLVNPQVSVFVKEHAKISVLGQVKNPGSYELRAGLSVVDAIALAGGFTEKANVEDVRLVRTKEGVKQTININANKIINEGEKDKDVLLEAGDLIISGELSESTVFVVVMGQVQKPGKYEFKKGMTAVEAIALAGGLTQLAAPNGTKVIRMDNGRKQVFTVPIGRILQGGDATRNVSLEPDDTIVVPESFF